MATAQTSTRGGNGTGGPGLSRLSGGGKPWGLPWGFFAIALGTALVGAFLLYEMCLIEVTTGHLAVLVHRVGEDLQNGDEVAPTPNHKGVQQEILLEGRHYRNPYAWDWEVVPQTEIPTGKVGVMVRLFGDELPSGDYLAFNNSSKGVIPGVKVPGRYPINPYLYSVQLVDPITIDAGFQGVVTNLSGPLANDPNVLLVEPGRRGTQQQTLREGTHLVNPYEQRVNKVDCRSQRFGLAEDKDFGFPSRDGFWVRLDAVIEFRIDPERVAEVYVVYNEDANGDDVAQELIDKVILPNARSFCRLEGSNTLAKDFLGGRREFQSRFQEELSAQCKQSGIQIIQALITKVIPPEQIAKPIQDREIARQLEKQFQQEILQQESERTRRIQEELVQQKQLIVEAEQAAIRVTTAAVQAQEVALTQGNQKLAVAQLKLDATRDEAAAIASRGQGAAEVQGFENEAEAAGWRRAVQAFGNDGAEYARYVLYQKLAGAYETIMINTADSPLMKIFESFSPAAATDSKRK